MKLNLIGCFVISTIMTFHYCNPGFSQPADNYYSIKNKMQLYFDAHPDLKNSDDGEYASFQRWCSIWKNRVDGFDQYSSGSFNVARQGWQQYRANKDQFSSSVVTGVDWKCLGPKSLSNQSLGLVLSIYVDTINDKSRNTIYLGSGTSGIWKTTDGGQNWHNCTDGSGYSVIGVKDIIGDPANGNILYAAVGGLFMGRSYSDGIGILRSGDRGVTWEIIYPDDQNLHMSVNKLILDPFDSHVIYACVDDKIIRSLNSGEDWDTIFQTARDPDFIDGEIRNIRDLEMKPFNRHVLYLATDDQAPWGCNLRAQVWQLSNVMAQDTSQIIKSRQDNIFPYPDSIRTDRFEIAVTSADSNAIFAQCITLFIDTLAGDTVTKFCLFKYDGTAWRLRVNDSLGSNLAYAGLGMYKNTLLVSPTDTNILYIGGNYIARYTRFKKTAFFHPSSDSHNPFYHVDTRCALIAKGSQVADSGYSDIIFAGNDGGISRSSDGASSWSNLNGSGLAITQFWGMGGLDSQPNLFAAGSQDNCMFFYDKNSSPEWQNPEAYHGDNGDVVFDPNYPSTIFFSMWGGDRTVIMIDTIGDDSNPTTIASSYGEPRLGSGNVPLVLNSGNNKSLYWGFHNLFRTSNHGLDTTKIPISIATQREVISAFCFSAVDTCRIYVANDTWTDKKFLRSRFENGEYKWTNLTDGLWPISSYYPISALETSPTNSDSVWMGFGGFLHNGDNQRVMLSTDGGEHWQYDYSTGLPNMPVNCIRFTNWGGRLFAGTDVGVFYRDRTMSRWESFNTGLPQCIVTDLEINETEHTIRAATFGRGVYETSINCIYTDEPLVINQNKIWSNDTVLENSVYIDSSFTLIIRGRVEFPPSAKIYVKQGAMLIIDGGFLTSHCSNMWQGIEVWGRSKMPHSTPFQGYVMVKNNSVIENARIAVSNSRSAPGGGAVWGEMGGIIFAENCTFRNNYKAIGFDPYPRKQVGEIINVTFETTQAPFIDGISYPSEFVSLFGVSGVTFRGCKFANRTSSFDTIPDGAKGIGIHSFDSDFSVEKATVCPQPVVPCPNPISLTSSFTGLQYGIKSINSNPAYLVRVQQSNFNNNFRGIYLSNTYAPVITQDTFSIAKGYAKIPSRDTCYGIYLDHCTLYKVEEDSLRLTDAGTAGLNTKTVGIVVDNSGKDVNEIYNNHFNSIGYGIIAQNLNRNVNDTTGLCIKCNDFSNTKYDIVVNQEFSNPDWGIARNQGWKQSQSDPAGNTFSKSHVGSITRSDIDNQAAPVNYFHNSYNPNFRVIPEKSDINKVIKEPTHINYEKATSCPSKISNGTEGAIETLKVQLAQEQESIDSISSILNLLTDGGDTPELNSTVATSMPSDAMQVRQSLLNSSPYLSDTVMKSAILKEDVLPNEMIRDILVANPQAPKSEDVMDQLNNRVVPMPDSLLAEIQNGLDVIGAKDSLGAELYNHLRAKAVLFNHLVNHYKTDTANTIASQDSLVALLQKETSLSAKYLLAFELLKVKDTSGVQNTLFNIPFQFNLDAREANLHQDYLAFFNVMNALANRETSIFELTTDQISTIGTLVKNGTDPVKSFARNVMVANRQLGFIETIILPDETKASNQRGRFIKTGKISVSNYMKIYPNPARQFIIVEYDLKESYRSGESCNLFLTNAEGKQVTSLVIVKQQDQALIGTASLPAGIYICTLSIGGKAVESQRVILQN